MSAMKQYKVISFWKSKLFLKRKSLAVLLLALSCLAFSFTQQTGEYTDREYYSKNCACLVREVYHPNGKLFIYEERDSITQEHHGHSIYFYDNGDTASYAHYKNGKEDSLYYNKYKNGHMRNLTYFSHVAPRKVSKYYDEDGTLKEITTVHHTDKWGYDDDYTVAFYSPNETLIYTMRYKEGKGGGLKVINQELYNAVLLARENITGEELFKQNCTSCHTLHEDATGPAMKGVASRHSEAWLRKWIAGPAILLAAGDKEAWAVYNKWNRTAMTSFRMRKKDMDKLIGYLKTLQ